MIIALLPKALSSSFVFGKTLEADLALRFRVAVAF